ncbi:MAG: signal transduction histidine kinase [Mycobacterium sp.]|nr:signal transduction histidine kinase [Mycobacterium sp.]
MTAFAQPMPEELAYEEPPAPVPPKRPSRWSLSNWPVRWKVLAIVIIPTVLAVAFGAFRIYGSATDASDLRLAADRAEMVPAIEKYIAGLEGALLADSAGGDAQAARITYDAGRSGLQQRLAGTDVAPDVRKGVTTILAGGQALLDKVTSNSIGLRDRVTSYAPILLTAEDAIDGSVRVADSSIRAQGQGLSRAVGARGQMMMQQLLVNLGAELPEPELRTSMITLAGTEPSTLFGMIQVLGVGSPDAQKLQQEMVKRLAIMSDPASVLVNNPDLTQSLQNTDQIAGRVINDTTKSVTAAVNAKADAARTAAIRDAVIVLAAILLALLLVTLVARSLVRPLRMLRDGALKVAHEDLAREIDRVRSGGEPGPVERLPVHTTEEVGQVAHAVDELHEQAVFMAGEQARLQLQVGDMFETLSRRSRSLVDQQLSLIDRLERNEEDPERLDSLFRLDHLAARMRRNGANLLVLAGARVPREQSRPVQVSAIINAAASEVEDYARVATATIPDSEIAGSAAGDLVHLLAELLDNALRYSPPTSPVRVSALHTGNGALVLEVSDVGLGMTEGDLRVANTRLESGGEVTPYTARHMGLFVVGRLAQQHGLVVRLRSSVAGEPNSGTTAGVYVPAGLIAQSPAQPQPQGFDDSGAPEPYSGIAMARALDGSHDPAANSDGEDVFGEPYLNGSHIDVPVALLPRRNPGASGISDIPPSFAPPAVNGKAHSPAGQEPEWPADSMPAQSLAASDQQTADQAAARPSAQAPTNTSAFFSSRAEVAGNGAKQPPATSGPTPQQPAATPPSGLDAGHQATRYSSHPGSNAGADDAIYQRMVSEWLIDPTELANTADLQWESVWDHGWTAAAAAQDKPADALTEHGLPLREPGARLVPGAPDSAADEPVRRNGGRNGGAQNGGAHRSRDAENEVQSKAGFDTEGQSIPQRDPDAVRATISNHFGGVHAGRSHAREPRGSDNE